MQRIHPPLSHVPEVAYSYHEGPTGLMGIAKTPAGVCCIQTRLSGKKAFTDHLEAKYPQAAIHKASPMKEVSKQFEAYFRGKLKAFDFPLDWDQGTPARSKSAPVNGG